jgi:putative phosphoesterase
MEIAIVSDTHMPGRGRTLPGACVQRLRRAELIIHAGDWITLDVVGELQSLGDLVAVHGNVDNAAVRAALPLTAVAEVAGHRIAVIHDAGPAAGRLARMRARFPDADAVVFGHSHVPMHERGNDGFQIFNPGSPTDRRRSPRHTMGVARAGGGELSFELAALD